jgi:hypothetical protein
LNEADLGFRDQVAALLGEMEEKAGQPIGQIASIVGDHSVTVQTAGSKNTTIVR